jgi:hypothetical protein
MPITTEEAIIRFGKAVADAAAEYVFEAPEVNEHWEEDVLNLPETLKDFAMYIMHSTDIADWSKP